MSRTVLICDDAIFMRTMVGDILQQAGFEIVGEAETGVQAVEKYRALRPNLVTMDIELPGMDGLAATERIMAGARVPILVLSAYTGRGSDRAGAALAAGALEAMPKSELRLENVDGANSVALRRRVKRLARARMGASTRPRRGSDGAERCGSIGA